MWRIPSAPSAKLDGIRITSTCVENTILIKSPRLITEDHLHMCGEYSLTGVIILSSTGSPPHVWRIQEQMSIYCSNIGITSTCVENTNSGKIKTHQFKDHLHMCGEYLMTCKKRLLIWGSPPHVWRIRISTNSIDQITGITSTCVENTTLSFSLFILKVGSPPHVWRIPLQNCPNLLQFGITSTCVENT